MQRKIRAGLKTNTTTPIKKRAGSLEVAQSVVPPAESAPLSAPASLPRPVQRAFSESNDLNAEGKAPAKHTCADQRCHRAATACRVSTLPVMLELEEDESAEAGVIDTATSSNAFGADTTSRLPAAAIMDEMRKALTHDNIAFSVSPHPTPPTRTHRRAEHWPAQAHVHAEPARCECNRLSAALLTLAGESTRESRRRRASTDESIIWEMEVCLLPNLCALHVVAGAHSHTGSGHARHPVPAAGRRPLEVQGDCRGAHQVHEAVVPRVRAWSGASSMLCGVVAQQAQRTRLLHAGVGAAVDLVVGRGRHVPAGRRRADQRLRLAARCEQCDARQQQTW